MREELCAEALRLAALLADHPVTGVAEVKGLLALMCLLAARLPARRDARGDLVPARRAGPDPLGRGAERARAGGAGRVAAGGESQRDAARGGDRGRSTRVAPSVEATDWPRDRPPLRSAGGVAAEPGGGAQPCGRVGFARGPAAGLGGDRRHREPGASRRLSVSRRDARRFVAAGRPAARRRCRTIAARVSWRATIRSGGSSIAGSRSAATPASD